MSNIEDGRWYCEAQRRPHHGVDAWQHGKELALRIYRVTGRFPDDEKYGLVSQLRRAAVSIPSNIAEGVGRRSAPDCLRFLYVARSSLNEVDTQLEIAGELGLLSEEDVDLLRECFNRLSLTLQGFIRHKKRHRATNSPAPNR